MVQEYSPIKITIGCTYDECVALYQAIEHVWQVVTLGSTPLTRAEALTLDALGCCGRMLYHRLVKPGFKQKRVAKIAFPLPFVLATNCLIVFDYGNPFLQHIRDKIDQSLTAYNHLIQLWDTNELTGIRYLISSHFHQYQPYANERSRKNGARILPK